MIDQMPEQKLDEAKRVGRLIIKGSGRVKKVVLLDYKPSSYMERIHIGVVVERGRYEFQNYDFLRTAFAGEVRDSERYVIHHFYPDELGNGLSGERGEFLEKMREGKVVARRYTPLIAYLLRGV